MGQEAATNQLSPSERQTLRRLLRARKPQTAPAGIAAAPHASTLNIQHSTFNTRARQRTLTVLHEQFAAGLSAELDQLLRGGNVVISLIRIEQVPYRSFVQMLPSPACVMVFDAAAPVRGQACLEIDLPVVWAMIDRLLGAGGAMPLEVPQRAMTHIELALANQLATRILSRLSQAWHAVAPAVSFTGHELESDPRRVRIVPMDEEIISIEFAVSVGGRCGQMCLCVPSHLIEALDDAPPRATTIAEREALRANVMSGTVELRATLGGGMLRPREVESLGVGDVITLDAPPGALRGNLGGGGGIFSVQMGRFKGARAVKILTAEAEASR